MSPWTRRRLLGTSLLAGLDACGRPPPTVVAADAGVYWWNCSDTTPDEDPFVPAEPARAVLRAWFAANRTDDRASGAADRLHRRGRVVSPARSP